MICVDRLRNATIVYPPSTVRNDTWRHIALAIESSHRPVIVWDSTSTRFVGLLDSLQAIGHARPLQFVRRLHGAGVACLLVGGTVIADPRATLRYPTWPIWSMSNEQREQLVTVCRSSQRHLPDDFLRSDRVLDATTAHDIGLVDDIVPPAAVIRSLRKASRL